MIRKATPNDTRVLAELAIQMWSNHTVSELEADFAEIVSNKDAVCFIKYADDIPVGFAQCQLRRDYVEGTHSTPVGYLEGIFVSDEYRHKGYAKELLETSFKFLETDKPLITIPTKRIEEFQGIITEYNWEESMKTDIYLSEEIIFNLFFFLGGVS